MRAPIKVTLAAANAISPWIPLDYLARVFNVGLFASLSEDSTGTTYNVEVTPDNPNTSRAAENTLAALSLSSTTVTATFSNNHGVVTGDTIVVWNSGDPNIDGTWTIASTPTPKQVTYTAAAATGVVGANFHATVQRVFPGPTALTGATTRQQASLTEPCWAVRLRTAALTGGSVTLEVIQGLARG